MNRIYRLVWNRAWCCLVVGSELTHARGKHGRIAASRRWLALPLALAPLFALAAAPSTMGRISTPAAAPAMPIAPAVMPTINPSASPVGGQVTAGSGNISHSGQTTTIDQHSQNLSLNWQSFNIGADSTVNFLQPDAQSIAVNRIADPNGSVILGHLNANGQVFLINPNGVLFGQGAQVDVGGLVASTLDVRDSELGGGTLHFSGNGSGKVVNRGSINAANGYVALLGSTVSNQGTLVANDGTVALGGGNAVTLSFDGNRLLSLQVDESALDALAENRQLIVADGGQVLMSAGAKDALLASTVNNTGVIQARTVENRGGRIILLGGMQAGTTNVAGTLDARAPEGGNGGFIETSAAHVSIGDNARITTLAATGDNGTWLIDPQDFTIAASGGDMTGSALSAQLGGGDVVIESSSGAASGSGALFINDAVSWDANTLTLTAAGDININAVMTAGGNAGLALNPYTANGADPATLRKSDVRIMPGLGRVDFTGNGNSLRISGTPFTLISNLLELQGISGDLGGHYALRNNIDASATAGWNPDGVGGFAGFDPLGTDKHSGAPFAGVFDGLGHTINGLTINRPDSNNVGLFGGTGDDSSIRNVGLEGGSTRGGDNTGALVGFGGRGTVSHAYATGNVHGDDNVGGLIGFSGGALMEYLYATGDVEGSGNVGGLLGSAANARLRYGYASGNVKGVNAGGLAGALESYSLWGTYATGDVTGTEAAGGLAGEWSYGTVWDSNASSKVSGGALTGGLVGDSYEVDVRTAYWDIDTSGQTQACGGSPCAPLIAGSDAVGLNTADVFDQASYAKLDFDEIWYMVEGQTRPFLRFEHATTISNAHQLQLMNMDLSASYTLASDIDASMTDGSRASGMWGSAGFNPIGTFDHSNPTTAPVFAGNFDGLGHTITGLTINRPGTSFVGLFGAAGNTSTIRNVGLLGGSVSGNYNVGSLVGYNFSSISQAYATGTVTGNAGSVGGLVGWSDQGTLSNVYATGAVSGDSSVGGLVGYSHSPIEHAYATGAVSGDSSVGGLAGANYGSIDRAYATGTVSGDNAVGGLAGRSDGVTGTINHAYATGAVSGNTDVGGLVGSYMGFEDPYSITNSYWNSETTGQGSSPGGGTALTSEEMKLASNFAGWDIAATGGSNAVWRIYEGHTAPLLRAFMTVANGSIGNAGKTYDGTAFGDYTVDPATISVTPGFWLPGAAFDPGLVLGQAHSDAVNAGSYALDGSGLYSTQMGYDLDFTPGTLTIDPKALTASLTGNLDKVYDGHAGLFLSSGNYLLSGFVGNDGAAIIEVTANYNSKNVADADTVTAMLNGNSFSADYGTLLSNYVLPTTASGTGHITPFGITVTADAHGKIYDATTDATFNLASSSVLGNDVVNFTGTGSFDDKNVGTGKTVTVTIAASGADAGNYSYNTIATDTADITPRSIAVDATASDKVYDASTNATVTLGSSGVLAGDTVNFTGTGSFDDKNAGTGKTVTVDGIAASGADAANYSYNTAATDTADITPRSIAVDATASDKVYDASTNATVTLGSSGVLAGDTVNFNGTGHFDDKNVGTAKAVTVDIAASGADAGNYLFTVAPGTTANITALGITVGATGNSKVYDGTAFGTVALAGTGVLAGDAVTFSGNGMFADKNVGTAKAVTVTGITAAGADAGNYSYNTIASTTADVTPRGITVDASANDKVYDATTVATISLGSAGVLAGDTVNFTGTGNFDNKNAGTGKTVTVNGIAASGADAGNYRYNTTATDTADIAQLGITVDATASDKVYDATTSATVALGSAGVLAGDTVAFTGTGNFADKNAGASKTVTVSGIAVSGADAGNYRVDTSVDTLAAITPATLTYQANPARVERGETPTALGGTVLGLVGSDTLGEATAGTLAWQTTANATSPAGTYAIEGGGLSALNYVFVQAAGNATALQVIEGNVPGPVGVPSLVASTIAGLQQPDDNDETLAPYVPDVRILGGGVRLP